MQPSRLKYALCTEVCQSPVVGDSPLSLELVYLHHASATQSKLRPLAQLAKWLNRDGLSPTCHDLKKLRDDPRALVVVAELVSFTARARAHLCDSRT